MVSLQSVWLLYNIIAVALLLFSHSFSTKCMVYNPNCIGGFAQSNPLGTNMQRIVTNTLRIETMTKWLSDNENIET